jgi:hypothetical protein
MWLRVNPSPPLNPSPPQTHRRLKTLRRLLTLRRLTKDFLFMHHVQNLRVINPFLVFADESGRGPSAEAIEAVKAFWGPDPVHPSIDCLTIAQAVLLSLHTALGGQ